MVTKITNMSQTGKLMAELGCSKFLLRAVPPVYSEFQKITKKENTLYCLKVKKSLDDAKS